MKFTPTAEWLAIATGASKVVRWEAYIRLTDTLNLSLDTGTWIDVTEYLIIDDFPDISTQIEYDHGQFTADSVNLIFADINYFKANIFNTANKYIELKLIARIGFAENNMSSVEAKMFAGLVDRIEGISYNESTDTVDVRVFSYDEYASRISAERTVTNPFRVINETSHLFLQNIPGLYIKSSNVSGFELTRGFHKIEYKQEPTAERLIRLNSGRWVEIPFDPPEGNLTLGDSGEDAIDEDNIRVEVHYKRSENITKTPDPLEQTIIQLAKGDNLPGVWFQRIWIFKLIEILVSQAGNIEYDFDDFRINTYDDRYETSFYEIPPGDQMIGTVNCLALVDSRNELYLGIGKYIYKRDMLTNTYTDMGAVAEGYNVVRIFTDIVPGYSELVVIARHPGTHAYRLYILNVVTKSLNGYQLNGRGTSNDSIASPGFTNFAYVKDPNDQSARGLIFYMADNGSIFYFDLTSRNEVDTIQFIEDGSGWELGGWSTGIDYFCQTRKQGALVDLFRVYLDVNDVWVAEVKALDIANIGDGIFNAAENKFIHSGPGGLNLWAWDHNTDTNVLLETDVLVNNFDYRDGTVYFIIKEANKTSRFAFVENNNVTIIDRELRRPFAEDNIERPYRLQYDTSVNAFISIYSLTNLLFQFAQHITMFVENEVDFSGKNIRQAIRDLCISYNITLNMNATKKWIVKRRIDDGGNLITSGHSVTLDADKAHDLSASLLHGVGYNILQIGNGRDTMSYDGTTFVDGGVFTFVDDFKLTINRPYLPSFILKDMCFYLHKFFSRPRHIYRVPGANVSHFQYEPFDGAVLDFGERKVNVDKNGVIVGMNINVKGNTDIDAMVIVS